MNNMVCGMSGLMNAFMRMPGQNCQIKIVNLDTKMKIIHEQTHGKLAKCIKYDSIGSM